MKKKQLPIEPDEEEDPSLLEEVDAVIRWVEFRCKVMEEFERTECMHSAPSEEDRKGKATANSKTSETDIKIRAANARNGSQSTSKRR